MEIIFCASNNMNNDTSEVLYNNIIIFITLIIAGIVLILSSSIIQSLNLNNKPNTDSKNKKKKRNRDPIRLFLNKKPNSDFFLLTTNRPEYNSALALLTLLNVNGVYYAEGTSQQFRGFLIPRSEIIEQGARNRLLPPHIQVLDQRVVSGDFSSLRIGSNGGILTHGKSHFPAMYRSSNF